MRRIAFVGLVLVASLAAAPAQAHGNAQLGDFYAGLFQPFFHPEFLLAALAIALWSTQQEPSSAVALCVGFAAAVLAGSAVAELGAAADASAWGPRLCALAVGPLVAARVRVPATLAAVVAIAAGLAHGNAGTAPELAQLTRPVLWAFGLGLGSLLLGAYANAMTARFPAFWMQVAVRVVGSWISSIALLVAVMATRTR